MSLELIPLCIATITPVLVADLGPTPSGHRMIIGIRDATWEGERFRAHIKAGSDAGYSMTIGADGTALMDVRLTLETDDGALIYMEYGGRRDFSHIEQGLDTPVYIAPRFETSVERYTWLNKIQAVGKGVAVGDSRIYEIYEVR